MTRIRPHLVVPLLALALSGCASTGMFPSAHLTTVELSEANYRVVATDVTGAATATYIVGVSAAVFGEMRTLALARVSGDGMLYGEALADLWRSFAEEHGAVDDRRLALVNVRFDSDALNLILVTIPTIQVRADVVEFTR